MKDVTGATSPYVRAALLDTGGDENAAADGLLRQRQEESDQCSAREMQENLEKEAASLSDPTPDQQFTCVGQQRPTPAQRIDPPGEAPTASSSASVISRRIEFVPQSMAPTRMDAPRWLGLRGEGAAQDSRQAGSQRQVSGDQVCAISSSVRSI